MIEGFEESVNLERCQLAALTEQEARRLSAALSRMDPWRALESTPTGLLRYLTRPDPGLVRYAVRSSDDLAGVVCVRYPWLCGALLELLAFLPAYQRRGMGTEIIGWLAERSSHLAPNLWTTVSAFNQAARGFYVRQGFNEITSLEDLVKPGFDELLLRRRLGSPVVSV